MTFSQDWISSEASKLLKGMDVFSLNLAKASSSISRGAFLTEAPNVGKSPTGGNRRSTFRFRNLLQQASTLKQTVLISTLLLDLKISGFPFSFLASFGCNVHRRVCVG